MATSWEEPAVKRVLKMQGVQVTRVDACQYGMTGEFHGEELPVKKPTKWMGNMSGVAEELHRTCNGRDGWCSRGLRHASCTGKRAEQAAIYPLELCKAILKGIRNHLTNIGLLHEGSVGMMMDAEDEMDNYVFDENETNNWMQQLQSVVQMNPEENEMIGQKKREGAAAHRTAVDRRSDEK